MDRGGLWDEEWVCFYIFFLLFRDTNRCSLGEKKISTSRNHSVVSLVKGDDKLGVGDEELALVTIRVTIIRSVYQASDDKYDKIKSTHI